VENKNETEEIGTGNALAFAPVHKRHFGTAVGVAFSSLIFAATLMSLLVSDASGYPLSLLDQFFFGYTVSFKGAVVGALWGFFTGWVGGWFLAFCRNFAIALAVFVVRAKANLAASSDFLDHI